MNPKYDYKPLMADVGELRKDLSRRTRTAGKSLDVSLHARSLGYLTWMDRYIRHNYPKVMAADALVKAELLRRKGLFGWARAVRIWINVILVVRGFVKEPDHEV